jgi:hypothetical protein
MFVEWSNVGIHHICPRCPRTRHPRPWLSLFCSWLGMRRRCPHGSSVPAGSLGRVQRATAPTAPLLASTVDALGGTRCRHAKLSSPRPS